MRAFQKLRCLVPSLILALLLGACGGGGHGQKGAPGASGAAGLNVLPVVSPAGEHCQYGGSKIEVGPDPNGNTALGSNQISGTYYACNGAAGSTGERALTWVAQSDAVTAEPNTGYIATNASTPVVVTLPDKDQIAVGDVVRVIGGAGGWKIAQTGTQQQVRLGSMVDASWTATGTHGYRYSVDSSRDGKILVTAEFGRYIQISTDGGLTWTEQKSIENKPDGVGNWNAVTISADGNSVTAAEWPGSIYAATRSANGSWTWRELWKGTQNWASVDSSEDGNTVVALARGGDAYTWTWTDPIPKWEPSGLTNTSLPWWTVSVSGDGSTAVAVGDNNVFYIRKKNSSTGQWEWLPGGPIPANSGNWYWVASSYHGDKLVAVESDGHIYTSSNGGVTWDAHESSRDWYSLASSADGRTLVAVEYGGRAYISIDSGLTWSVVPGEPNRWWYAVTISADGSTVVGVEEGGQIHVARNRTTPGKDGYISGGPLDSIELIYLGNDLYEVRSHEGRLTIR